MKETLVFETLEPQFQDVRIGEKDYKLCELDTPDASTYKSTRAAGMRVDGKGGFTPTNAGELDPLLVSLSLKEVRTDGTLGRLSRAFVNGLHPTVVRKLAEVAKELNSSLDETPTMESLDAQIARLIDLRAKLAEDPVKNSRNGTMRSSD
jgi:hypothetical protein